MPVYLGIDWSQSKQDLCYVNQAGVAVARATIPHSPDGFLQIDRLRAKLGVPPAECWVGLETAHHLLLDFLWARGYSQVYVLSPNVVKSSRTRYRQSGRARIRAMPLCWPTCCGRTRPGCNFGDRTVC